MALEWTVDLAWLIIASPLLGFLVVALVGKRLPEGGAHVTVGSIGLSFVLALLLLVHVLSSGAVGGGFSPVETTWFTWVETVQDGQTVPVVELGLLVDNLSAVMLTLVSFLSLLIAIYSIGYMHAEEGKPRYYAEIALFVTGMLGTVSANNYLQLLIFWEIMGLCSYLLIGFWYRKPEAASAAKKAFLVTRIGDILFLAGILISFVVFGTFNFHKIEEELLTHGTNGTIVGGFLNILAADGLPAYLALLTPLLIFGGAVGKSAQFPLHAWLPDAMEGPTTVSALIHAATMVKAGVFLVARALPLFADAHQATLVVAAVGGFTALFAATMGLVQYDIKRVLAYSTISQLGYMFLGLGTAGYLLTQGHEATAAYSAGLFHLMNHAFFKALLFLAAGSVIHAVHTNDLRLMGGLRRDLPWTSRTMLVGAIALAGLPPLSGFWSKDEILATVFDTSELHPAFLILWGLGIATAFLTAFYAFRLWFMTFAGSPRAMHKVHESPGVMTVPLIILAAFAVASGFFPFLTGGWGNLIFLETVEHHEPAEILAATFGSLLTYLSIGVAALGVFLAYAVYVRGTPRPFVFTATPGRKAIHQTLSRRYYIDDAYDWIGAKAYWGFATAADWFDRHVVDGVVNGIGRGTYALAGASDWFDRHVIDGVVNLLSLETIRGGRVLRRGQGGRVQEYAAVVVLGLAAVYILIWILRAVGVV